MYGMHRLFFRPEELTLQATAEIEYIAASQIINPVVVHPVLVGDFALLHAQYLPVYRKLI